MQNKQTSGSQYCSFFRQKANSFQDSKRMGEMCSLARLEFSTLSFSMDLSLPSNTKRISLQNLMEYIEEVLDSVYENDPINLKATYREYIKQRLPELKPKLQERLSLLKYLEESLKYKSFSEIDLEIQKEWKKNVLFFSISAIWAKCILNLQFKKQEHFAKEYEKYRNFIANVTQYYFRGSLKILNSKKVETLTLIFEDSSHQIINNLKDWHTIYDRVILRLLKPAEKSSDCETENEVEGINFDFDLSQLKVNQHYLNPLEHENQLEHTTRCIDEFSKEYKIHEKISLLKKIRTTFMKELTDNSNRIATEKGLKHLSQLEKDDILDCMIYCIIKGQIQNIGLSLQALMLLLGKNSDLLSRKGVDSYRADLQGAIQYLCNEQMSSPLIKLPKNLMSTQVTSYHCM